MSLEIGWETMNLNMTPRVARLEFDAEVHWDLVKEVVGIDIGLESSDEKKKQASLAFMNAWNYDLFLRPLIGHEALSAKCTNMGHAEYSYGGEDYDNNIQCPFKTFEGVLAFDPMETYGPINKKDMTKKFNEDFRKNCKNYPDVVNTTGTYITLFSGFIAIFGWDMFLTTGGYDPEGLGKVANRYAAWMQQYYDALAESDAPVIYSHDDIVWTSGAVFHPEWYRKYIFPNYKKYYAPLIESGKKVIFLSDGNYTEFVDDIAQTGVHGFFLEPLTDLKYLVENYGQSHVIIGNADTRILLMGTKSEIRQEVERCMNLGKNCPGFFMGVSNMIPPNTPVENAIYYNEVYQELCKR